MNPELIDRPASPTTAQKRRPGPAVFLALTALVVLAGCASDGYYGGPARYPDPSRSGGYSIGGAHRGYSYGIQHGFGRSGFGGRRH